MSERAPLTDEQAEVVARISRKTMRGRAAEAVRLATEGMPLQDAAQQAGVPYVTALKAWRKEHQIEATSRKRRVTRDDVDAMVAGIGRAIDRMLTRIDDPKLALVLLRGLRECVNNREPMPATIEESP